MARLGFGPPQEELPAKEAARKLGIPLAELWEAVVREKAALAARAARLPT